MTNSLGLTSVPFGAVTISATCPVKPVIGQMAVSIPCAATLTSRARSVVKGQAQLVDAQGNPHGAPQNFVMTQGQTITLAAPPVGQQWLVVDVSQDQADEIVWGTLATIGIVGGLAVVGGISIVRDIAHRHRGKHHHSKRTQD